MKTQLQTGSKLKRSWWIIWRWWFEVVKWILLALLMLLVLVPLRVTAFKHSDMETDDMVLFSQSIAASIDAEMVMTSFCMKMLYEENDTENATKDCNCIVPGKGYATNGWKELYQRSESVEEAIYNSVRSAHDSAMWNSFTACSK